MIAMQKPVQTTGTKWLASFTAVVDFYKKSNIGVEPHRFRQSAL